MVIPYNSGQKRFLCICLTRTTNDAESGTETLRCQPWKPQKANSNHLRVNFKPQRIFAIVLSIPCMLDPYLQDEPKEQRPS